MSNDWLSRIVCVFPEVEPGWTETQPFSSPTQLDPGHQDQEEILLIQRTPLEIFSKAK